jgi:two-component system heavy metal sensor histidine kinase CusS
MTVHDLDRWRPAGAGSTPSLRHDLRHELATLQALLAAAGDAALPRERVDALLATAGAQVGQAMQLLEALGDTLPSPAHRTQPAGRGRRPATEQSCEVEPVLRSAVRASAPTDRSISVSCPGTWRVALPRTALVRVVGNLLRNAVSATGPGGAILLTATPEPAADAGQQHPGRPAPGHVRIEVHDDGPGPGAHGFHRPGGVGLSVVRSLVLPAGGWLVLGRSPHGGACAAVTLPLPPAGVPS